MAKVIRITPGRADKIIKSVGMKIGYCEFTKINNEHRRMWFQGRISPKLLAGGPRKYNPKAKRLTWVRDIMQPDDNCIRSIKWDSIKILNVNNKRYVLRKIKNGTRRR